MTTAAERLSAAIHLESAAISPHTSPLIEASKEALAEIERLPAENEAIRKDRDDLLQQALGVEAERDIARMENERLASAVEDAINTLEAMDLHVDNPLYERLCAVHQQLPPHSEEEK